jgi:hypothetical protein
VTAAVQQQPGGHCSAVPGGSVVLAVVTMVRQSVMIEGMLRLHTSERLNLAGGSDGTVGSTT